MTDKKKPNDQPPTSDGTPPDTTPPAQGGNGTSKYQIFPDLSPEEEKILRTSIKEKGVLRPIIKDKEGNVVEGHQRKRIATELGKPCPEEVRHFESEREKFEYALDCNRARRSHLTGRQKRQVIAAYLKGDPEISSNWLGEILGVAGNTVEDERRKLEGTSQIAKLTKLRGKDGKKRPACKPKMVKAAKKKQRGSPKPAEPNPAILRLDGGDASDGAEASDQGAPSPEELKALQQYVDAVNGWARAQSVFEEGYKQWKQNQEG